MPGQDKKYELPDVKTNDKGVFVLKTKGLKVPKEGFKISGDFWSATHPKRGLSTTVRKVGEKIEKGEPINIGSFSLVAGRIVKGRIIAPESDGMVLPDPEKPFVKAARGMPGFWYSDATLCDSDGNFEVLIPKAGLVELLVGSQNYAGIRVQVPPKANDLGEIKLLEGTEVFGSLTDTEGNPVVGAIVNIAEVGKDSKTQLDGTSFEIESSTKTDSKGKYRLPPHRGECQISIEKYGRLRGSNDPLQSDLSKAFKRKKVTLKAGEKQHRVDLNEAPTTWVRGTIRWPDGRPCQNVEFRSFRGFFKCYSDKDGKYSLPVLADADEHAISAFGIRAKDGTFHYAQAVGEISNQFARLKGTGKDINEFDWTLVSDTRTIFRNAGEAGQALDEISLRLNNDRKAFFEKLKKEGVPMLTQEVLFGKNSAYQKYPDQLLEMEKEYRGEFSALVALKRILEWSDKGLTSAQKNRKEVLDRIRKHYLDHEEIDMLIELFSGSPTATHRPHVPRVEDEREDERELYELIRKTNSHDKVQAKILFQDLSGKAQVYSLIKGLEKRKWKIPPISTRDEMLALKKLDPAKLKKDAEAILVKLKKTYPKVIRYDSREFYMGPTEDIQLRPNRVRSHAPDEFMTFAAKAEAILLDALQLQPREKVPEVVGKDAYGKPFKLSDLKGKAVVFYFAANWAKDSFVQRYEESRDLKKQYKDKLEIVTIMLDKKPETIRAAIDAGDITWPAIDDGDKGPIARAWNIDGLDREAFLIDKNGVIVERISQQTGLAERVEKLMKGPSF